MARSHLTSQLARSTCALAASVCIVLALASAAPARTADSRPQPTVHNSPVPTVVKRPSCGPQRRPRRAGARVDRPRRGHCPARRRLPRRPHRHPRRRPRRAGIRHRDLSDVTVPQAGSPRGHSARRRARPQARGRGAAACARIRAGCAPPGCDLRRRGAPDAPSADHARRPDGRRCELRSRRPVCAVRHARAPPRGHGRPDGRQHPQRRAHRRPFWAVQGLPVRPSGGRPGRRRAGALAPADIYGPHRQRSQHEVSKQIRQITHMLRRAASAAPANVCATTPGIRTATRDEPMAAEQPERPRVDPGSPRSLSASMRLGTAGSVKQERSAAAFAL